MKLREVIGYELNIAKLYWGRMPRDSDMIVPFISPEGILDPRMEKPLM